MARYAVESIDRILVKTYGFLWFAKNMSKNIVKNVSKILNSKYIQNLPDNADQYATEVLKTTSK